MKKIKCPCCNKEMEVSETPLRDAVLYDAKCRNCHIAVTTDTSPKNLDWLLFCFYRGQWDFEMKYINGEIIYARVGGGHRPLP